MSELHVLITGMVQGVGFRWFVRERARRLRLAGWVRNRPDGSVEVAAAGNSDALAELRSELARGPDGARVDDVRDLGTPAAEPMKDPFDIIR